MIKKSAQDKQKQNTEKLRERVDKMFTGISEIAKSTGVKVNESSPKLEMLENLTGHCEDHVFWKNFNKAAPMLFCALMENNNSIKQVLRPWALGMSKWEIVSESLIALHPGVSGH